MRPQKLIQAVASLAQHTHAYDEATLSNPAYAWGDYPEIRMALLGTIQELDELAAHLLVQRAAAGNPLTRAQRLLGRHRSAYRDLQALLVGVSEEQFTTPPTLGEWSIQQTLHHIYGGERLFLGSIVLGLQAVQNGSAATFERTRAKAVTSAADPAPVVEAKRHEMLSRYEALHRLVQETLVGLTDADLDARAPYWEPQPPSVTFRIGRFTGHLHEHTVQIEKTLAVVAPVGEAKRHIRRLYRSLAEVEGALFGMELRGSPCDQVAEQIEERASAVTNTVADSRRLFAAIQSGEAETVRSMVESNERLVRAIDETKVSALLTALYHRQVEIAEILRPYLDELSPFEAAAMGDMEELRAYLQWNPETLNWFSTDGFTPLQLACFFGREAAARFLLTHGANVHAVSRNPMQIQPIHAAVAGRNAAIVLALIEAGANVTATQAGGFTPLQAAEENGDQEIARALRAAGA